MQFESFEALKEFVRNKEETDCIQLVIKHSRSIEIAAKRGVTRFLKPDLKYYEVTYRCIHSGKWKSTSNGIRPNQSSFKKDCPFIIRLRASLDGQSLVVAQFVDKHNHEHNKETYSLLPRQRHIGGCTKQMVKNMWKYGVNTKLLLGESENTEKVTGKNLHDINVSHNKEKDNLKTVLEYLMKREGNCVEVFKDNENFFQGLFYQDLEMKTIYEAFPEILFIDSIYEVSNLKIPLFIFAVENGNGEAEIVAFFLAANDNSVTMKTMVNAFKRHNSAWRKTVAVMTDKDFAGRSAFQEGFSNAKLLISLFHTFASFKRDINCETIGIKAGERTICLLFAEKLAYAKNEEIYNDVLEDIQNLHLSSFLDYFMTNWHSIRKEWVPALQDVFTSANITRNSLESINPKVMQIVRRHPGLLDLFVNLDCLLLSLRAEQDERSVKINLKVPLNVIFFHDDQKKYLKCLTPFAYGLVEGEFKKKNNVTIIKEDSEREEYKMKSSRGVILVTCDSCSCTFWTSLKLPCHHILHVRQAKELSLFSESLMSSRWTKNYLSNSRLVNTVPAVNSSPSIETMPVIPQKALSQHEKFHVTLAKIQTIATLASEAPMRIFTKRLEVLDRIIEIWGTGKEAFVEEILTGCNEVDTVTAQKKSCVSNIDIYDMTENFDINASSSTSKDFITNSGSSTFNDFIDNGLSISKELNIICGTSETTQVESPLMSPEMKKRGRSKGIVIPLLTKNFLNI